MAVSIKFLGLLLAEVLGVPALLPEALLVYTLGIACGGSRSRLSAMWADRRRSEGEHVPHEPRSHCDLDTRNPPSAWAET
jgi:hypothetical protein